MGFEPTTTGITIRDSNQLSYIHHRSILARPTGLEPATVGLEGRCSIRLSYRRSHCAVERFAGRGRGIRTPDFCVPNATLYQTELYPVSNPRSCRHRSLEMLRVTLRSVNPYRSTPSCLIAVFAKKNHLLRENKTGCKHPASPYKNGAPGEIRTPDHLVRSQVLYPTELRAH